MDFKLNPAEVRVLGCLIEKDLSTPDYYPLSLNALVNACNQKSNRDPLMNFDETLAQNTLDALIKLHLVVPKSSSGSRVTKYAHRLSNPVTKAFDFSKLELAILCELLVRGPQSLGELRTRAGRLVEFTDLSQVEATMRHLQERVDGPCVVELPRQTGRRDVRFAHLFSGEVIQPPLTEDEPALRETGVSTLDRIMALESQVQALRGDIEMLKQQLVALREANCTASSEAP